MKKIHVIFKTHLDLGYTDYAANIEKLYAERFFPKAALLAREVNTAKKRFIWTTGSWIIERALKLATPKNKELLERALKNGDIVPHALPFTTHTELLDADTFRYGLEIGRKLKEKYDYKLIAAKMTDVPGHTKAMLPLLSEYGIKFLHIGVNGSSAVPQVPRAFVWKYEGAEVVVLYDGSYGSLYKNEHMDDILYFAHSLDNCGPVNKDALPDKYKKLEADYPDYTVEASTLDDYAAKILEVKDKLPVVTSEIGDSWIHGAASDPYKSAAARELIDLKNSWLADGTLTTGAEYEALCDGILTLCEHTWGMDVKPYLSDIGVFLKKDFNRARKRDAVSLHPLFGKGAKWRLLTFKKICRGVYNKGRYSVIEKSWREQREYIDRTLGGMTEPHRKQAEERIGRLIPEHTFEKDGFDRVNEREAISGGECSLQLNEFGAIKNLTLGGVEVFADNGAPAVDFISYGAKDYDYWFSHYSRDVKANNFWLVPDFGKPALERFEGKYPQGAFPYKLAALYRSDDGTRLIAGLYVDTKINDELGAPSNIEIQYTLKNNKLIQEVIFTGKDASRLTEAIFLHFGAAFDEGSLRYKKLGGYIDPYDVVVNGNRNLAAVESVEFSVKGSTLELRNCHSPLAALGRGKILKFDNIYQDVAEEGLSFCLYNNVWGTNFPVWYSDNAYFRFELSLLQPKGADDQVYGERDK